MTVQTLTAQDDTSFVETGTTLILDTAQKAIAERDRCVIGLSGGSTPQPIYAALGQAHVDWDKLWFFLIDERHIASDHKDSNTRLVRQTLLATASEQYATDHFLHPNTALPIDTCVTDYERRLSALLEQSGPIDLAILGMGDDGHIASLFPPVSTEAICKSGVLHTVTDRFAIHDRISVTLPILQQARHSLFLLRGEGKKKVWEEMLASIESIERWPAKALLDGNVTVVMG